MQSLDAAALDLADIVRPGDTILWGQACGEPQTLVEALIAQRAGLGGVSVFLGSGFSDTLQPEHADHIRFTGIGGVGTHRRLTKAGVLEVVTSHISRIEPYIRDGILPCDVVFVQVSPPDESGNFSFGLISDSLKTAIGRARVVVAEINSQVPQSHCAQKLFADEIDFCIMTDRPPVQVPAARITDLDRAISRHANGFIPDRATLQVGVGAVPEALMMELRNRKDLGIHSGMIGDSVVDLLECGALTNAHKGIDAGVTITGALIGTRRLYDFAHRNPALRMHPSSYTHDIRVVAGLRRFISINSAIEVDLTGQVNAESTGGSYIGAIGGQVDYVRAASASEGGRSLIALPSTAQNGALSRIVFALSGPVTSARSDVDVIVTEHGAAELRGKTLPQRIKAMIGIADPAHRDALQRAAFDMLKTN